MDRQLDLIVLAGAPGVGKGEMAERLREYLRAPVVSMGKLRSFHLGTEWRNTSAVEEQMTFDNLIFVIQNYIIKGYRPVIVHGLSENRLGMMPILFKNANFAILSLYLESSELVNRVHAKGDENTDPIEATQWNQRLRSRGAMARETKVDNTHPDRAFLQIQDILRNS